MINPDLDVCPDYTDIENIHQLLIAIKKNKAGYTTIQSQTVGQEP